MARRLETLTPGTPVLAGAIRVGEVRAVYAEGESRVPEFLVVRWDSRNEDVVLPTTDVNSITDDGVVLMQALASTYADLAAFDADRFPTAYKLG